jgi:hypothetical protein
MNTPSLIESLFGVLRAEEEHWLPEVFVRPPLFNVLKQDSSTIVYGESGSGLSATRRMLKQEAGSQVFVSFWSPDVLSLSQEQPSGTQLAQLLLKQILGACVENLILEGGLPNRLPSPAETVQAALQWFLHTYLPFEPSFYLETLADRLTQEEQEWYLRLLKKEAVPILRPSAGVNDQMRLWLMLLRQARYERLWIAIDASGYFSQPAEEKMIAMLEVLLSTLAVFRIGEAAFKLFMPVSAKAVLRAAAGVERLRAEEIDLRWREEDLIQMILNRLKYAFGDQSFSFEQIFAGGEFINWLREYGGSNPRDWLALVKPLVIAYAEQGKPLTAQQCRQIIRQHPPRLRLDRQRREVWIGRKCIPITSDADFRLLEYLVDHAGKICSLAELYYYAHERLDYVPSTDDKRWIAPASWRGAMDTLLWRIRKKIEPDPQAPVYLITHRGQGVELMNL